MNKKVIVFDMDGVLFDTIAMAEEYMLEKHPKITVEMQKELMVGNFHEEYEKVKNVWESLGENEEEKKERSLAYSEKKSKALLYDGVHILLKKLHQEGYVIALNTSAIERNTIPLLEKEGIKEMFDFIGTAEVSRSKIEKFRIIQEKYGVEKKDMLFITDTLGDIREAKAANIPTVAVTWGAHDTSYFNREPHTNLVGIVDTVEELEKIIEKY